MSSLEDNLKERLEKHLEVLQLGMIYNFVYVSENVEKEVNRLIKSLNFIQKLKGGKWVYEKADYMDGDWRIQYDERMRKVIIEEWMVKHSVVMDVVELFPYEVYSMYLFIEPKYVKSKDSFLCELKSSDYIMIKAKHLPLPKLNFDILRKIYANSDEVLQFLYPTEAKKIKNKRVEALVEATEV